MADIKVKDVYRNGVRFELFLVANRKGVYNTLELRYGVSILNGYYLDIFSKRYKTDLMITMMVEKEIDKDIKKFLTKCSKKCYN